MRHPDGGPAAGELPNDVTGSLFLVQSFDREMDRVRADSEYAKRRLEAEDTEDKCISCGGTVEPGLLNLGSVFCHDCR